MWSVLILLIIRLYWFVYDIQSNEYNYKKTLSRNKDVLIAVMNVQESIKPMKEEIKSILDVTQSIIGHLFVPTYTCIAAT